MPPRKKADEKGGEKEKGTGKDKEKEKEKEKSSEKVAKASGEEAVEMVRGYLERENRPYSAGDVAANLRNKVSKAAAAKILKDLHERGEIEGRASGKQLVYHAIQPPSALLPPTTLSTLDTTLTTLTTQTATLLTSAKSLRTTLTSLTSTAPTAALLTSVSALEAEKAAIETRLKDLRAGNAKKVGKREREAVDGAWTRWERARAKRRRICKEMWGVVEGMLEEGGEDGEGVERVREGLGVEVEREGDGKE